MTGVELIAIGGFDSRSSTEDRGGKETWRMNLESGTWRRAADMPRKRFFFGSSIIQDRIVAIGHGIDQYNPGTDRWETLLTHGVPDSHFGAASLGNRVYMLGGFPACGGGCIGFDLESGRLFDPPEPPGFMEGDHFHILETLAGEVHAIGGLDGKSFLPTKAHFVLRGGAWQPAAAPPKALWAKFAVVQVVGDDLFVFEGPRGLRYSAREDRWATAAGMPYILAMPASFALNGAIRVVGGLRVEGGPSDEPLTYLISEDRWQTR